MAPYCEQNCAAHKYSSFLLEASIFSAKIAATGLLISKLTSISMLPPHLRQHSLPYEV